MNQLFDLLFLSSSITLVLLVWFNSDAFIEYVSLFGLESFFGVDVYKKELSKNPLISWIDFLSQNYNGFFIKLLTCPLCLSLWVSLVTCLLTNQIMLLPTSNLLSLILYKTTVKILEK